MKTKHLLIAFAVTALIQLSVPAKMIYDCEITARQGTEYKFKAEPVDPNDPFRGKYITLSFSMENLTTKDTTWLAGETAYIALAKDSLGFAKAAGLSRKKPETDYITTEIFYKITDTEVRVKLPFDRYYMEESKAPEAETAYGEYAGRQDYKPVYALVGVKDGNAVLKDVIIDGMPIKDYVVKKRK